MLVTSLGRLTQKQKRNTDPFLLPVPRISNSFPPSRAGFGEAVSEQEGVRKGGERERDVTGMAEGATLRFTMERGLKQAPCQCARLGMTQPLGLVSDLKRETQKKGNFSQIKF